MTVRRKKVMSLVKTVGNALLAGIFITGGYGAFKQPGGRVTKVENAGIPMARQATILNGGIMMAAGTTLAVGILPKLSALLLIGTLVPTTFVGHNFWDEDAPQNRANQQIQFMKNLSTIGGLMAVLFEK